MQNPSQSENLTEEQKNEPTVEALPKIIVIGGTGQQGGAVTKKLLESKMWDVCVVVRAQSRAYTKRLRRMGATIVTGNMYDPVSLDRAFHEAFGLFFITDPMTATSKIKDNEHSEYTQGVNVVNAAKKAGIRFVIYSASAAPTNTKVQMFDVKDWVSTYLREQAVPHCIVRPAFLMENFNKLDMCCPKKGFIKMPVKETTRIQMVSCLDIADFVQEAFTNTEKYLNQRVDLAGDELTGLEIAEAFQNVCEQPVQYKRHPDPISMNFVGGPYGKMLKWLDKGGFQLDLDQMHAEHPSLRRFADWLVETGWETKDVGSSDRPPKIKWSAAH